MREGESGESLSLESEAPKTKKPTYGGCYVEREKQKGGNECNASASLAGPVYFSRAIDDGVDKFVCEGRQRPWQRQGNQLPADQPRVRPTRSRAAAGHESGKCLGGVFQPDEPVLGERQRNRQVNLVFRHERCLRLPSGDQARSRGEHSRRRKPHRPGVQRYDQLP